MKKKKVEEEAVISEIELLKEQLDEEKDRYIRQLAEFDNFRKRTQKDREEFIKYANEQLILELVDVLENLERGLETAKESNGKDKLIEGMELVYKQFKDVLESKGLASIKAVGEQFDPYKHEAMMITQTDECGEDTVLEEYTKGYMLNNNVIRCSKVRVSKNKE